MNEATREKDETRFTIDGRTVCGMPDETVMSVAKRHGIRIPGLCHHESVAPYGACRLCLVEAFWGKRSKLVTSCIYVASGNDVIETKNDRVRRARKMILDLLLARCPDVEVIRELAREYGVEESGFPRTGGAPRNTRCILCGLCVRVCSEVIGRNAISYSNRGIDRVIGTPFDDQSEECVGCGACVFVCPTGALHCEDVGGNRILKELNTTLPLVKCRVCGRPFATEKEVAMALQPLNMPAEVAETCPGCRKKKFTELMGQALVVRKTAPE